MLDSILKRLPRWLRADAKVQPVSAVHAGIDYQGEHADDKAAALKGVLVQKLRLAPGIRRAFLVRAMLPGAPAPGVLLVLAAAAEPAASLTQPLLDVVQVNLPADVQLTLKIIKPGDCAPIERVCRPFYYAV
jgi:hypothetical protein